MVAQRIAIISIQAFWLYREQHGFIVHVSTGIALDGIAGKVDQSACSDNLGNVIKRSLPADVFGLLLLGKFAHVYTIAGNVVCGTAESDDSQQGYGYTEEVGQVQ